MTEEIITEFAMHQAFKNFDREDEIERDTEVYYQLMEFEPDQEKLYGHFRIYHAYKKIFHQKRRGNE